jgi:hypothetical protein
MKCTHCKRKFGITLKCASCGNQYCTGCIQLELHDCTCIHIKIEKEKKVLEERNIRVSPPKKV